jgi:hypothetical protein
MNYDQTLVVVVADNDDDLLFMLVDIPMNLSRDVCMCMYVINGDRPTSLPVRGGGNITPFLDYS